MSKIYEALKIATSERKAAAAPMPSPMPSSAVEAIRTPVVERQAAPPVESVMPIRWPKQRLASRDEMLSLHAKVGTAIGGHESRAVIMTSARSGEGATSIAREFALAVAESSDRKILLVDANPTENGLHRQFQLPERPSLEDVARRNLEVSAAIHQLAPRNLHLARLSPHLAGPSAIVDAAPFDGLFARLRASFNEIIIDAPPVIASSTSMVLAKRCDGVILVLAAERTRAPVVEQAKKVIAAHEARLIGVVMNRRRHHIPNLIYRRL
ncbi:MAG: CpsD/CapB family tyrosine-protein kinase [Alphaproteobacteria bacterium]|nr:CpsD/CapB family tyrosine-protein kinase [Alphaproteobacteria bacterium]